MTLGEVPAFEVLLWVGCGLLAVAAVLFGLAARAFVRDDIPGVIADLGGRRRPGSRAPGKSGPRPGTDGRRPQGAELPHADAAPSASCPQPDGLPPGPSEPLFKVTRRVLLLPEEPLELPEGADGSVGPLGERGEGG